MSSHKASTLFYILNTAKYDIQYQWQTLLLKIKYNLVIVKSDTWDKTHLFGALVF